ncbi:hypothetical protein GCM10011380_08670 [Sphingomonas metalli]|uniref:Uncharacterized protein n=1 Tax=Sphingomonas metalli TaxID=1779358 RepID=A0A916SWL4_9SPHN|nr:hypothetical protein GCM10011380_08670 [Sphingomonas metalli]
MSPPRYPFGSLHNTDKWPKDRSISIQTFFGATDQFTAKIAHGYAMAVLGPEAFKPYLNDMIVSGDYVDNGHLIGSSNSPIIEHSPLHRLTSSIVERECNPDPRLPGAMRKLVVVEIELFAHIFGCKLEVVAGELK